MTFWVAGAVIGGATINAFSANKASNAQVQSAKDANSEAAREYDQARTDQMPWLDAGRGALGQLTAGTQAGGQFMRPFAMADYQADPGYQFRLDQGNRGIQQSAAARGGLLSGAAAKAISKYNSDQASQEYQNSYNRYNNDQTTQYNRLASLAGVGQTAANMLANVGQQTSQSIQNNLIGAGNARASGYMGAANGISNGIGQGLNNYQNNQLLSRLAGPSGQKIGSTAYYANNDYLAS